MASNDPLVRLGDYVEACLGKMLDAQKNRGVFQPYLGNSNVRWGAFDLQYLAVMRFEQQEEERYGLRDGDLIVCEGGEPGRCAIWQGEVPNMKIQKALHRIRVKDGLDNYFLYYWFLHAGKTGALEPYFTGTTIKHLTGKALAELQIPLAPIERQRGLAKVLRTLDDKIGLNRRINQTLEAMAQAIFKSWFVDFDPVKAKIAAIAQGQDPLRAAMRAISGKTDAELDQMPREHHDQLAATAALFPNEIEESELGEIPKGWAAGAISDLAEVTIGGDWGKDQPEDGQYVQAVCLRGVDLEHLRVTGDCPKAPIRWVKKNSIEKRQIQNVDLLIGGSGAGPCGRPLYASPLIAELVGHPVIYSNFVKRFRCKHSSQAIYLEHILWEMFNGGEIQNYINGTSVPNLNDKGLMAHSIVLPESQLLKEFEKISQNWLKNLYLRESKTLSVLRDILLPKLLSGELSVADLEVPA